MTDSSKPAPTSPDTAPPDAAPDSSESLLESPENAEEQEASEVADAAIPEPSRGFPVVGVGASAGGLEALETFLGRLPRTGMAFVVIQHLAPGKESHLPQILSRSTRLPVAPARDGLSVEADHVYVIPPGANLAIFGGKLHLMDVSTAPSGEPMLPVDFFFSSLAKECGGRCMGVVLSGTGLDGTRGLQEIREAGGLTFAQDPATARFPAMPSSAAAGADAVLAPDAIADELVRISRHPYLVRGGIRPQPEDALKKLFFLIRSAYGTDISFYKYATVRRRIERRMALHKVERLEDYIQLVQSRPAEMKTLYRDLLINVTSFFRDVEPFTILRDIVFPRIIERKKSGESIRVWVPACSTGEEAYSIGICLLEALGDRAQEFRIQVFATDLDGEAIAQARQGLYPSTIGMDVSSERLRRFFSRRENSFQVGRRLRELVVFANHDLTRDASFSRLDLCSCRNLFIYLQGGLQKRALKVLHHALVPEGFLMLGTSETVGDAPELFTVFEKKNRIYVKRGAVSTGLLEIDGTVREHRRSRNEPPDPLRPLANLQQLADRKVLERFGPAGVLVNDNLEVLQFRGRTGPYLEPQPGAATLNLLRLARPELHVELRSVIQRSLAENIPTTARHVGLRIGDKLHSLSIEVHPIRDAESGARSLLVLFREDDGSKPTEEPPPATGPAPGDGRVEELERELAGTKAYLQSAVEELETSNEELKSANEELQSSNEELQSTNEELETSKEELQSSNEELSTVNDELQNRLEELSVSNDDLVNLLATVAPPVVMVSMDLRLRRLTESAEKLFGLSAEDLNRPVAILRPFLPHVELERLCRTVIDRLVPVEQEVHAADGRKFELRIRPYRTADHVIGGAVLTLATPVSSEVQGETVPVPALPVAALVLNQDLRVVIANAAAADVLGRPASTLQGVLLEQLGSAELADPRVRVAVERTFREGLAFHDLPLERERRVHGVRLPRSGEGSSQVLMLLENFGSRL